MKTLRITACIMLFTTAVFAQSDAQKSFDQLKSLTGSWEGKNSMGQSVQVSYRMTAGGSALMSEIVGHGETMISMINFDGPILLLTHYCAVGNQPRMQASTSPDGKTITFNFFNATNLDSPQSGHMDHVSDRPARTRPPHRGVGLYRSRQGDQVLDLTRKN